MRSTRGAPRAVLAATCLMLAGPSLAADQAAAELKDKYRRPPAQKVANQPLVSLGRDLFFDPRLSASGQTACATCHFPELGWGVKGGRSINDSGVLTSRKSQPLIGIGHMAGPFGWDGRNASLEAQAKSSIATGSMSMRETDRPVKVEVIEERIKADPLYVEKFKTILPDRPLDLNAIVHAVAVFERALEPGRAPFDDWIDGNEAALSEEAKRGFALFNGEAGCSACHAGWRFTDDKFHDIGTRTTDRGRGRDLKDDGAAQFAFKTPTLRAVVLRPAYMHDGSLETLRDVVMHYEKGGIDRPSRSSLMLPFSLTDQQRDDLVAFLSALTDKD